ncbi:MAG: replicative DNA helicase [candidate division Zixibacteria bacterium]|nr:replicative DNA helicase [candidate division Zixibacteria bacterium]MBU1469382.1 replicative DNA helicase [candidate division Zixibacteria bacterium]MBU2626053.1 replicative DNA helicase [candidate division Zixibacteria bacterium]
MAGSDTSQKQPPHSVEAERAVLSAVLNYRDSIHDAADVLTPECFYDGRHEVVFASAIELYNDGIPIDLVTISDDLTKKSKLDKIGGIEMLTDLLTVVSSSANVRHHAEIIYDKFLLRRLKRAADDISIQARNAEEGAEEIINHAENEIFRISQRRLGEGFVSINTILPRTFDEIENYRQRKGSIIGTPTGYHDLDRMTSGLQDNDLIVVAGRPSMGKTALALNICAHIAMEEKRGVGLFSLEMSANQISQRMLCAKAHISPHMLRSGMLRDEDYTRLGIAVGPLSEAPIFIDDSPNISILELRSKARRLKVREDIGLLVIDYLQMMHGGASSESRQQEISQISRSLKALAKDLSIPVMAVSQLSRAPEMRGGDRRPQLADLRESGAIEQDADLVAFVYREEYYLERTPDGCPPDKQGIAEIIVAKQRNGPTGVVKLTFLKDYIQFVNPEFHHREPAGVAYDDDNAGDVPF